MKKVFDPNLPVWNSDSPIWYCDADGVCLDWLTQFINFCESKGHIALHDQPENFSMVDIFPTLKQPWKLIEEYQQSEFYAQIKAYDDAKLAFAEAKEAGVDIIIVTSCGKDDYVVQCRKKTVEQEFNGVVSDIRFLDYGASKLKELKKYRSGVFMDDQEAIALEGRDAGHHSLLRCRSYNRTANPEGVIRVDDMRQVSRGLKQRKANRLELENSY